MHAFNLRFGPAASPRQRDIYRTLVPTLSQVLADTGGQGVAETPPPPAPETGTKPLQSAAKQVFKGMKWNQLDKAVQP